MRAHLCSLAAGHFALCADTVHAGRSAVTKQRRRNSVYLLVHLLGKRTDLPLSAIAAAQAEKENAKWVPVSAEIEQEVSELEEEEAKARGALTPQECYTKLSADYADVLQKCIIVCDAYKYIEEAAKRQETHSRRVEAKLDVLIAKQDIQAARVTKTAFPSRPKRLKDVFAYLFKDIPLYCLHRAYRSRHVRQLMWICLLCIWLITVAIACYIIHDNNRLRQEIRRYSLQREYIEYNSTHTK